MDKAAKVGAGIVETLERYIHPLTGGTDGKGWEFGKKICLSDIAALLEGIPDVDFIEKIVLYADGEQQDRGVDLDPFTLPFSGKHRIDLKMKTEQGPASQKNG